MDDEQIKALAEKCILANPLTDGMLQTRIEAAIKEALELEREKIADYVGCNFYDNKTYADKIRKGEYDSTKAVKESSE